MNKNKFVIPIAVFGVISACFFISFVINLLAGGITSEAAFGISIMVLSIGLCVLFIILRVKYLKQHSDEVRAEKEKLNQMKQAVKAEKDAEKAYFAQFKPTRSAQGIRIDEVHKLVSIVGFTNKIYRYSDIAGYNVLRREQSATKGHSLGRAVVGGAVAGVVGAAVGAASGLETKSCTLLAVDISLSRGGRHTITLLDTQKPVSNAIFLNAERALGDIVSILDTVIAENNVHF